jgi:hypothetical protein
MHILRSLGVETQEPQTDKSGDVADQEMSPYLDMTRPRSSWLTMLIYFLALNEVTSTCWKVVLQLFWPDVHAHHTALCNGMWCIWWGVCLCDNGNFMCWRICRDEYISHKTWLVMLCNFVLYIILHYIIFMLCYNIVVYHFMLCCAMLYYMYYIILICCVI